MDHETDDQMINGLIAQFARLAAWPLAGNYVDAPPLQAGMPSAPLPLPAPNSLLTQSHLSLENHPVKRRQSQPHSFEENLAAEKARLEARLAELKHGPERDAVLKKIRQLETASHMSDWLRSPGLKPPE